MLVRFLKIWCRVIPLIGPIVQIAILYWDNKNSPFDVLKGTKSKVFITYQYARFLPDVALYQLFPRKFNCDAYKEDMVVCSPGIRSLFLCGNQKVEYLQKRNSYFSCSISLVSHIKGWQNHSTRNPSWLKFSSMSWHWYRAFQKILSNSAPHMMGARDCTELFSFGFGLLAWESLKRVI